MTRECEQLSGSWTCQDTISICFEPRTDLRFDSISNAELQVGTGAGSALFTNFDQNPDVKANQLLLPIQVNQYLFVSEESQLGPVAFMRFEVINTSFETFDSVYVGMFSEMGTSFWAPADYMGCDTSLQLFYNYSQDEVQDNAYEDSVRRYRPTSGVMFLNQHLGHFVPFHKSAGQPCSGFPRDAADHYQYLLGQNRRNQPYYAGQAMCNGQKQGARVTRLFPDNPLDTTTAWSMRRSRPRTGDHYGMGSAEPWPFAPHDTVVLDLAFIIGHKKRNGYLENLEALFKKAGEVREWYEEKGFACYDRKQLSEKGMEPPSFKLYPNPAMDWVRIASMSNGVVTLRNATGEELGKYTLAENQVLQIDLQSLPSGFYTLEFESNGQRSFQKLVVSRS